ncbi:MAG: endonuclease MutS2, partial [Bacteroidales bacterium]|nr:endonuclease MutS2 [Bacteroidales bacterium]
MIYPSDFEEKIGFKKVKELVAENCLSPMGIENVDKIRFLTNVNEITLNISATKEFQNILNFEDTFPSDHYYDNTLCLEKIRIEGSFPEIHEVFDLKRSLETAKSVLNFFRTKEGNRYPVLSSLCKAVKIYPYVSESIERIIDRNGNIKENASSRLKEIRTEINAKRILASRRLQAILKQAQAEGIVDKDAEIPVRNGRGVIPVNIHDKRRIRGLIHDQSASGKTVFIEPEEVVGINNDIVELEYEERREIVRILTAFADNIRPYIDDLLDLNRFLGEIDFIRAKALFGNRFKSTMPSITDSPGLSWRKAIHPLLALAFEKIPGREVVPLDIKLDSKDRILLISGPNAGGKSVCLKTVGLLQYMLQCGFTIPVAEGSESGIFSKILIDIGDEQSIENDLSTYSYHLINMKNFLKHGDERTLILIDEFGTGTEPGLGGSIAEAILGEFNRKGLYGVITTHYTNLKHFASVTEGIVNGAMAFDSQFMQPLFQLYIGKPGSSFAFEIARKIGLPEEILAKASEKAGVKNISYDKSLREIARDKRYWENKRQNIRQHEKRLEKMIEQYERELSEIGTMRKEILSKAREEAKTLLSESNKMIENTIRQIRESQAEKEKTKQLRRNIEEFRGKIEKPADLPEAENLTKTDKLISQVKKLKIKKEKNKDGHIKPGDA